MERDRLETARQSARQDDPRFWSKGVQRGECLEYGGFRDRQGYGQPLRKSISTSPLRAHRYAYELTHGPIPAGAVIRHTCDNPPCINPDHLLIGTQADNIEDRQRRGRHRPGRLHGAAHPQAKLTEDQARELVRRFRAGEKGYALAAEYGISPKTAYAITSGRNWRHLRDAA